MYSDRNLVNRRNVKSDVSAAANACRRFFQLEVEARIIAAALSILGMKKMDDEKPIRNMFEGTSTTDNKKSYLHHISSLVVDKFVVDQKRNTDVEQSLLSMQEDQDQQPDVYGRFPCRFPGCSKTFAHHGKLRKDHEAKHNPLAPVPGSDAHILKSTSLEDDDMFSYQRALLDYGLLILNFFDAISEGDGERVIRCWKFFLMYLKHQGANKYSLEALYLMFQINAMLSPQAAHRLIWNRFIKNKQGIGGNIPLDLQLEFYNKLVKDAIKKLGPHASKKSLDRICHSLGITSTLMKSYDSNMSVFNRAGKHVKKSTENDLKKIVQELVVNNAFTCTPGRRYKFYSHMKPSILIGFDMQKMFSWISNHKKLMILNRRVR